MRSVSRIFVLGSVAVFFLSFAAITVPAFAQSASTPQYVTYSITGNVGGHMFNATVNESVVNSSRTGFSRVTYQISTNSQNFSFSRIMNSSKVTWPYFPMIANQSLAYNYRNITITASINQSGTGSVRFNDSSQQVSNFTFAVSASGNFSSMMGNVSSMINSSAFNMTSTRVSGNVSVFSTGLVYSASIVTHQNDTFNFLLLATNLPLATSSSTSTATSSAVVVGGAGAAILVGAGAVVWYRRKNTAQDGTSAEKPLYHVD